MNAHERQQTGKAGMDLSPDSEDEVVADLNGTEGQPDDDSSDDEGPAETAEDAGEEEDDSMHVFSGHTDTVFAVSWSRSSGDTVASGGADDRAFLWRAGAQDGYTCELRGHTDTVSATAFSGDGSLLATAGLDGRVFIWDAVLGDQRWSLEGPGEAVNWLQWHPRGNVLLAGSEDFTAWLWHAQTGACMHVLSGHNGPVTCGAFVADGRGIVTGGGEGDAALRAWNPKTGDCLSTIQGHTFHSEAITCLAAHADGTTVITGSEDSTARLSNTQTSRVLGAFAEHTDSVEAVAFSPVLQAAVTASMDGKMLVWDNSTLALRVTCQHNEGVVALACHPTAPMVFTGCLDGVLRGWDIRTGSCVREWVGHTAGIQALDTDVTGAMMITGSDDHTARIFGL